MPYFDAAYFDAHGNAVTEEQYALALAAAVPQVVDLDDALVVVELT